jgi:hypothetical protein
MTVRGRGRVGDTRPHRTEALDGNGVCLHRLVDVLELLRAELPEGERERLADLLVDRSGDAHAPWLGYLLKPRADIDPVSQQIASARDDIANVDSDPEPDTPVRSDLSARFQQPTLDRNGALDGIDRARELRQDAVPRSIGDPPPVLLDEGIHDLTGGGKALQGAEFVQANESRIPRDVCRKDRGKMPVNPLALL